MMDTFRLLDRHGHLLKEKYKGDLKRHIRYDDDNKSLYLDVKPTKTDPWQRILPEEARRERLIRETEPRSSKATKQRTLSTLEEDSDEDFEDDEEDNNDEQPGPPGSRPNNNL